MNILRKTFLNNAIKSIDKNNLLIVLIFVIVIASCGINNIISYYG